ncbi:MAG: pyridoxamine 5'-phosphate oxidase family protein [Ruminococcus sp.]|nr:pyridoxamine 5'-phosphate oxidase family protein [Ruminococcus sp.]
MSDFNEKLGSFLADLGEGRKMVLSTAENGKVSSRMMSVVCFGGKLWFQTDKNLRKYRQLTANKFVSLCIDNIQIEGICEEFGHPLENGQFCEAFKKCFKVSFDAYTSLKNERLFCVEPVFIERWIYIEGVPYIETFDLKNKQHKLEKYISE